MNKWTKGPWRVLSDEARGKPRCLIVDARGDEIAAVNPYRDTWEANAKLMASAPRMLKLLKELSNSDRLEDSFWKDDIDAAIQQAEGGA